jgi:hypothetical protein
MLFEDSDSVFHCERFRDVIVFKCLIFMLLHAIHVAVVVSTKHNFNFMLVKGSVLVIKFFFNLFIAFLQSTQDT